jgi:hypothetical protein
MLRSFALLFVGGVAAALFACSTSTSSEDAPADAARAGSPAPDGARGVCCPAQTGGCALTGGYRESGPCPTGFDTCDNMCEQRIVKDEHGCDVLTYKQPPVATTYAGTESCSEPVFNGGPWPGREAPDAGDAGAGDAGAGDAAAGDAAVSE